MRGKTNMTDPVINLNQNTSIESLIHSRNILFGIVEVLETSQIQGKYLSKAMDGKTYCENLILLTDQTIEKLKALKSEMDKSAKKAKKAKKVTKKKATKKKASKKKAKVTRIRAVKKRK